MSSALAVEGIDVFYDASQILFGVDLAMRAGEIVALLGRNGAGKSTTFKAIAGIAPPRRGRVRFGERDLAGLPPHRIARAGIGYVPEDRQVFPEHSVEDNLAIGAKPGPAGQRFWTISTVYEVLPELHRLRARAAGRLSGGEQQMLTIARALMGNPDLLLLDEPTEGLAPVVVERIMALLHRLRTMGMTVLLAEQNMFFCVDVADEIVIIDKGQIVHRDTAERLSQDEDIKRRYLAV